MTINTDTMPVVFIVNGDASAVVTNAEVLGLHDGRLWLIQHTDECKKGTAPYVESHHDRIIEVTTENLSGFYSERWPTDTDFASYDFDVKETDLFLSLEAAGVFV